jgi:threonine/homoserine/homoserine lactone efflux protein
MIFLRSLLIGLSIAAPVGPIGVLCIRRTLAAGRLTGFVTGLGAATADAFYGGVGGLGISAVAHLLLGAQIWLRLVGGIFLCYLGITTLLSRPAERPEATGGRGLPGAYLSTLGLTLTNPLTIFSFAAIFAGLGFGSAVHDIVSGVALVAGVFAGSALWWFLLSGGVSLVRQRFNAHALVWVNRISGAVILIFGIVALASLA